MGRQKFPSRRFAGVPAVLVLFALLVTEAARTALIVQENRALGSYPSLRDP